MQSLDITAIILTKNERVHIVRCLERLKGVASRVVVVDSLSTDGTQELAREHGAEVVEHAWPGNQAAQFNWALDNLQISTAWILRLDADEYLTPELIEELRVKLPGMSESVSSLSLSLARCFMGRRLRHGIVNSVEIVRMFRPGCARYENRIMDEHLAILKGSTVSMQHQFVDDNLMPIGDFIVKHNNYASREAALLLIDELAGDNSNGSHDEAVERKRRQKSRYARMPLFWRAFGYFGYRYIFRLGFLDGKEGFLWDFMQGWWYRTLVDAKVLELKRASGGDATKLREILARDYGISL